MNLLLKIIGGVGIGFGVLIMLSDPTLMPPLNTGSGITQMFGLGIAGLGYWIYQKGEK